MWSYGKPCKKQAWIVIPATLSLLSASHTFCTATYCNVHAIAIPDVFKRALNKCQDSIRLVTAELLAAAPWLVGSGECVAGLEQ